MNMQQALNELENAKRLGQDTTAAEKRLAAAKRAEAEARESAKQTAAEVEVEQVAAEREPEEETPERTPRVAPRPPRNRSGRPSLKG